MVRSAAHGSNTRRRRRPPVREARHNRNGAALKAGPHVRQIDVFALKPSPENKLLYRERGRRDGDFRRLVKSIRSDGVQAPLLVSLDWYIVSGHQRLKAAIAAGLSHVPCIVLKLLRSEHTADEWTAILREHNCGREKTFDELVRERLVDVDPAEAAATIIADRTARGEVAGDKINLVRGFGVNRRSAISSAKRAFADASIKIIGDLRDFWPLSVRQVHYRLLNDLPLRNSRRPKSRYQNDRASYQDLSDVLTRLRLTGEISWQAVSDETRPVTIWRTWRSAAEFIGQQTERFLTGYSRDWLQSQPNHIEIVAEKLTVQGIVNQVAARYAIPVLIGRGYSSIDARHGIVERFEASGKDKLVLLCLSDCDPDGDVISESLVQSLLDDFHVGKVEGARVALTHEQCDRLDLPPVMQAKEGSSQRRKFVEAHGTADVFELEAVPPTTLQEWIDDAIRASIDVEAFDHERKQEQAEAVEIQARRQAAIETMKRQ